MIYVYLSTLYKEKFLHSQKYKMKWNKKIKTIYCEVIKFK